MFVSLKAMAFCFWDNGAVKEMGFWPTDYQGSGIMGRIITAIQYENK